MFKNYKWMMIVAILLSAGKASAAESIKKIETNEVTNSISVVDAMSPDSKYQGEKTTKKESTKVQQSTKKEVKDIVYLDAPSPFSMYENDQKLREQSVKKEEKKETPKIEKKEVSNETKEIKEEPKDISVQLSEVKETETWVEEKAVMTHEEEVEPSIQPMTIYMGGISIPYQNGGTAYGQSIIDSDGNMAATWGGQSVQSGDDGLSTHIIGHNPGIFSILFSLSIGSSVQITDGSASSSYYSVTKIWRVDDYGVDLATGEDTWELITGANNGESVVFQTCIDNDTNLIVMAQ